MAQTGYTPILIYSSSTVSQAPAAGNLTNSTLGSELAINITDGKLFYKDNANAVQVIAWKTTPTTAGGTGLTSYTAGDLLYYATGTTLTKLAIGTSTTVLTSSGSAPQWTAQSSLSVGTAANLLSNATTGVMQIVGPSTGTTRVMTIPDSNFTVARTDAGNAFTGNQTVSGLFTAGGSAVSGYQFRFTGSTSATFSTGAWGLVVDNTIAPPVGGFDATNVYIQGTITKPSGGGLNDATALLLAAPNIGGSGTCPRGTTLRIVGAPTGATTNRSLWVQAGASEFGGDVTLTSANIVQGTAAKGFNFTANTAAAGMTSQLLNWYEEGTWTPALAYTTPGTSAFTYNTQRGYYTRVGRNVTLHCVIRLATFSKGTASGNLTITGIPFTSSSLADCVAMGSIGLYDTPFANIPVPAIVASSSVINLFQLSSNAGWASMADPDADSQYIVSITYTV